MKKILIVLCYSFYVIFAYATRIDVKKQKIDLLKGDSIYLNIKCNKHCDVNMYILKKRYTKKVAYPFLLGWPAINSSAK